MSLVQPRGTRAAFELLRGGVAQGQCGAGVPVRQWLLRPAAGERREPVRDGAHEGLHLKLKAAEFVLFGREVRVRAVKVFVFANTLRRRGGAR